MADQARNNLLAAIRAKGQSPSLETPNTVSKPFRSVELSKHTYSPGTERTANSDALSENSKISAFGEFIKKAALTQIGSNIETNSKLISRANNGCSSLEPVLKPENSSDPLSKRLPTTLETTQRHTPRALFFSAADLQAQLKLRAQKREETSSRENLEATTGKSLTPYKIPPKLELEKVALNRTAMNTQRSSIISDQKRGSIVSYRSGIKTIIDAPAKMKTTPTVIDKCQSRSESKQPVLERDTVRMKDIAEDSLKVTELASQNSKEAIKVNGTTKIFEEESSESKKSSSKSPLKNIFCAKPTLSSLVSPLSPNSPERRSQAAQSPIPQSVLNGPTRQSATSIGKVASPERTPITHSLNDRTPGCISPPATIAGKLRLLTEPIEVRNAWRKLSCRVLRENEVPVDPYE